MTQGFLARLGGRRDAAAIRVQAERAEARGGQPKAAELWRELAEAGDPDACWRLGLRLEQGQGVVQNFVEATAWFRRAADGGAPGASAKLGEIYFHGRSAPASVTPSALAQDEAAGPSGAFGKLFPGGFAVAQDFTEAALWNLKAAEAGDGASQVRRAYQCASGLGVGVDLAEAERWFAAAAAQGEEAGEFALGMLYAGGHGGAPDPGRAAPWFEKAAARGNVSARLCLGMLLWRGDGMDRDEARAAALIAEAAEAGHPEAMFLTGQFHRFGVGAPADPATAESWLRRAAARGHVRAMTAVGGVLLERTRPDPATAAVYLRQAAELGDGEAQCGLGQILLSQGQAEEAGEWFQRAADQGVVAAFERLGAMYADGVGLERDLKAAAD